MTKLTASNPRFDLPDPVHAAEQALAASCTLHVGIDGGATGAIGMLLKRGAEGIIGGGVWDLPTVPDPTATGKASRRTLDLTQLYRWLRAMRGAVVAFERFVPIPAARAQQMHGAEGEGKSKGPGDYHGMRMAGLAGEVRGLLAAAALEIGIVRTPEPTPQQYRKRLGLLPSGDKEYLRLQARRLLPALEHRLTAMSHHNRAEALLLGYYATIDLTDLSAGTGRKRTSKT